MVGKKVAILVDFDFITYTDMGLYTLVKEKYAIPSLFDLEVLNVDPKILLFASFERKSRNPLSIIMNDNANVDIDKLYQDMLDKYYPYIVENSFIKSGITDFINIATKYNTKDIGITILTHNDAERKCIATLFQDSNNYTILDIKDCTKEVLASFSSYYVKDFEFFKDHDLIEIAGKAIYVQSLRYNLERIADKTNEESEFFYVLDSNKIFITNLGNLKDKGENYDGT